MKLMGINFS
jgi:hypothetical protein